MTKDSFVPTQHNKITYWYSLSFTNTNFPFFQFQINIIQSHPASLIHFEVSFQSLHRLERNLVLAEHVIDHRLNDFIGDVLPKALSRPVAES